MSISIEDLLLQDSCSYPRLKNSVLLPSCTLSNAFHTLEDIDHPGTFLWRCIDLLSRLCLPASDELHLAGRFGHHNYLRFFEVHVPSPNLLSSLERNLVSFFPVVRTHLSFRSQVSLAFLWYYRRRNQQQ